MKSLFLLDKSALVLNKKERILYFLLIIFFFSLYIPGMPWLYNFFIWLFFVYSFFFNSISEKWMLLRKRKEIIIMILFFLLNCLSALLSENRKEGISLIGIRISLFIVPVAIGTLYIKNILKERLVFGFAVATTCATFFSLLWAIWHSAKYHDLSLLYNDNLSGIVNFQSIYFALLLNLAMFSFIYLLIKKSVLVNKKVLVPVLLILFVAHFLLASRIAIIILYSTIFIFAILRIVYQKKIMEGIILIAGLCLTSFLLVKFFPKTVNRFEELSYIKFDYSSTAKESHFNMQLTADQWNGANIRIAVWRCAWTVIKNNMALGTGLGDKMDELKKQYEKKGFAFGIKTNRNTHNNYLDVWMSLGLTGLIIFLCGFFIFPLFRCIKFSDWYGLVIVICFMLSLFTENYMDRTIGNVLLAFFLSFVASYKKPEEIVSY